MFVRGDGHSPDNQCAASESRSALGGVKCRHDAFHAKHDSFITPEFQPQNEPWTFCSPASSLRGRSAGSEDCRSLIT